MEHLWPSENNVKAFIIYYALKFVGVPYKWGGNNPLEGFDCSGFVQEVLKSAGIDPPGDQTSQALYNDFGERGWRSQLGPGSVLFFGKSRFEINHVAIAINDKQMVEAGGGDSQVVTKEDAERRGAFVRIRSIKERRDLVAVLAPEVK